MRIDVTYAGMPPRIIETSGESMLSSSTVANAPEWLGAGLPVTAVMLRPRTDLLADGRHGLTVELCAWSAATDGLREGARVSDLGNETEVPRLLLHAYRAWEVLPADEVAHAVAIDIDGRIHVRRVAGRFLDLTAYERLETDMLGRSERDGLSLAERVVLLHKRMREAMAVDDARVGELYGLGTTLHDWALSLGGDVRDEATSGQDDGNGALVKALAEAGDFESRASVLLGAILDDPALSVEGLEASVDSCGVDVGDVSELWVEAEGRLADEEGWDDDASGASGDG